MKKPGFSLIEVLIALFMLGIILPSLFSVQSAIQRMLVRATRDWSVMQIMQKSCADLLKKEPLKLGAEITHTYDGRPVTVTVKAPAENSALRKIKDVGIERTIVTDAAGHTYGLVRLVYRPAEKEKEPEKPAGKPA